MRYGVNLLRVALRRSNNPWLDFVYRTTNNNPNKQQIRIVIWGQQTVPHVPKILRIEKRLIIESGLTNYNDWWRVDTIDDFICIKSNMFGYYKARLISPANSTSIISRIATSTEDFGGRISKNDLSSTEIWPIPPAHNDWLSVTHAL